MASGKAALKKDENRKLARKPEERWLDDEKNEIQKVLWCVMLNEDLPEKQTVLMLLSGAKEMEQSRSKRPEKATWHGACSISIKPQRNSQP